MSTEPLSPEPPPLPPPVEPPRPITQTRPEILVGAAFAGGLVLAKVVGAIRGR